jgi:hypothetical protein
LGKVTPFLGDITPGGCHCGDASHCRGFVPPAQCAMVGGGGEEEALFDVMWHSMWRPLLVCRCPGKVAGLYVMQPCPRNPQPPFTLRPTHTLSHTRRLLSPSHPTPTS